MDWKKLFNEKRPDEILNVRLPVTWTDRIMEYAALLTLLAMWVVAAILYRQSIGSDVAIHINAAGDVDEIAAPESLLIVAGMWTFVMLLLGFSAYRPRLINPGTKVTTVKQLKLMVTQVRVMNIVMGFMGICILLAMVHQEPLWILISALVLFIVVVVFSVLIRRARK